LEQALQEQSDLSARAPEQVGAERADALAELARLDGELKRLGDAVATGAAVDTLLAGIKTREAERRDTLARLEHLDGVVKAATADRVTVEELREIVKDWHGYLAQKPEAGQQALRKLLAGPIVVSWQAGGAWSIKGQGKLGRVFEIAHVLVPEEEWTEGEQWNEASDDEIVQYSTAFPLRGTR